MRALRAAILCGGVNADRLIQRLRGAAGRALGRGVPSPPNAIDPSLSPALQAFVAELPLERAGILRFVSRAARETPAGARVLDAGAGDAPYRELFSAHDYVTTDWAGSMHSGALTADVVASLDDLPLEGESFDAVVCTQVLEHLAEPQKAIGELHRVLRPGGRLWITAPLVWELHEAPYDFFRYTAPGLEHILRTAGFGEVAIEPRNGYFTTMALLASQAGPIIGSAGDGRDGRRRREAARLRRLAHRLAKLDDLDARRTLPLGYQGVAVR